jgi:DNA helicase II / ATP-dependent DNA helicase PcrA
MPKELNENQKKAVEHRKGALLVVAGAGTGKTKVITERIRHLIENEKVKPSEILALTFTDKASNEMLNRVGDIMPLGFEEPWIYTFHSFADRIMRAEGIEVGLDPSYKILTGPEQWILLRQNIFKMDLSYFRPLGNPTKFISAVLKFISRLQDENITPQDLEKFTAEQTNIVDEDEIKRWKELSLIYKTYQKIKTDKSRLDFGDLITWTLKLFQDRPHILKKYRTQFKHMMVDEFQDTNYAQYELVKMLFPTGTLQDATKLDETNTRTLLAVGDDSQSIYKFRGAAVSNILEFMKDYPEAEMVTLLQNYRSTQKILDPAYKLIQNNNPDTLESRLGISKQLTSEGKDTGPAPQVLFAQTLEDEVDAVVSKIYEILGKEPQYTYKDIAILARANSHLEPFVMALRQKGIPYQLVGNRGLYDREEIRDILALLKTIVNPGDSIALYRALNIPSYKVPYEDISEVLSRARIQKRDMWTIISESKKESLENLFKQISDFQQKITKQTPVEFIFQLIHGTGYLEQFINEETIENQMAIKNLDLFLNIIKKFEVDFHNDNKEFPTVVDLLDYLELMIEAGDNPAQAEIEDIDTVNLLTTHGAKGLEYPVVFIVNVVADRFPSRNQSDVIDIPTELIKETLPTGDEHIQEERRLFYVALTRACKYLYITLAKDYGGKREKRPSGFIGETGISVTEVEPDKTKTEQQTLFGPGTSFRDTYASKISNFVPEFLSYSQIDTYINCPLQYKYRYVLNIPTMPNNALSFGTTIHDTLREYHSRKLFENNISLDDLLKMYEKNWQPLGYMNEEHRQSRFESGKKLLADYYEKNNNLISTPVALEKSFNIKIDGIRFYGRIDRIDKLPDGSIEIIDYKTGAVKPQKEVDKDMQVALYALAAKEALNLDPKTLSYYFVEDGQKLSTTRTPEQMEEMKEEVKRVISLIKKGSFEANPGMQCNWCDYKDICPYAFKG